jgi:hypothetical protein
LEFFEGVEGRGGREGIIVNLLLVLHLGGSSSSSTYFSKLGKINK